MCGMKWADDEGGKTEFVEPPIIAKLDALVERIEHGVQDAEQNRTYRNILHVRECMSRRSGRTTRLVRTVADYIKNNPLHKVVVFCLDGQHELIRYDLLDMGISSGSFLTIASVSGVNHKSFAGLNIQRVFIDDSCYAYMTQQMYHEFQQLFAQNKLTAYGYQCDMYPVGLPD